MKSTETLLRIFRQCSCTNGLCDECPNASESIINCDDLCGVVSKIALAMFEDLNLACKKNNPCLVCGHFRPDMNGKCDLLGWACSWEWRGVTNG